jgi:chaperonin GroEL
MLEDIAVLTNGTYLSEDLGRTLESVEISELGRAKKIVVTKDDTTVIEGAGKKKDITARADQILASTRSPPATTTARSSWSATPSSPAASRSSPWAARPSRPRRHSRTSSTTPCTPPAPRPRRATSPAAASRCSARIDALTAGQKKAKGDEKLGFDIVTRAIEAPARQIALNAGFDGDLAVETILESDTNEGLNAATGDYEDLVKAGIIDPALVIKSAIINAASVAGLMLTTDVMVTDLKEDTKPTAGAVS